MRRSRPRRCRRRLIVDIVRDWLDARLPQPLDRVLVRERQQRARLRRLIEPHTGRGAS